MGETPLVWPGSRRGAHPGSRRALVGGRQGWQKGARAEPASTAAGKLMNGSMCVGLDGHGTFPGGFAHATRGCGEAVWVQDSEPG